MEATAKSPYGAEGGPVHQETGSKEGTDRNKSDKDKEVLVIGDHDSEVKNQQPTSETTDRVNIDFLLGNLT